MGAYPNFKTFFEAEDRGIAYPRGTFTGDRKIEIYFPLDVDESELKPGGQNVIPALKKASKGDKDLYRRYLQIINADLHERLVKGLQEHFKEETVGIHGRPANANTDDESYHITLTVNKNSDVTKESVKEFIEKLPTAGNERLKRGDIFDKEVSNYKPFIKKLKPETQKALGDFLHEL
jgi:hypothetical protein